ncbi:HNH endonuclease [Parenemella sanctibonifatiensis]
MPASVDSATTDAFVTPAKDASTHDTPVGDASAASTDADASPIDHRVSTPSDSDAVTPGVPAGTPSASPTLVEELRRNVCHIPGTGPITAATAQRLACTATLQAILHDSRGNALALGRSRRLASPGQRRALAARDHHTCQFPGCQQHYRLDAHHITPWALGGKTDLDNLVLLCRRHHTLIHEAGITITASAAPVPGHRFRFRRANGAPIEPIAPRASREYAWAQELSAVIPPADANVGSIGPIDVRTVGQGEGFNLHECVRVLFELTITDPTDGDEPDPSSSACSNDSSPTQDTLPAA